MKFDLNFKQREKAVDKNVEDVSWLMDISKLIGKIEAYKELLHEEKYNKQKLNKNIEDLENQLDSLL